ncbi:uncharacterized protein EI90DRAFT_2087708 [Cantharellus anzutake]|uniref:uncharacterized protein n=1 Tax=Cantharellus anzutake TaxID=1750568 RepID=UPI0019034853|nr:uncharacterized protein EI90DRAFT_2087708 [Cantharellus anzutake]KAF8340611.1 hypothetical protein EI90DRAFT_2087708 [Cantharellus anzutake]
MHRKLTRLSNTIFCLPIIYALDTCTSNELHLVVVRESGHPSVLPDSGSYRNLHQPVPPDGSLPLALFSFRIFINTGALACLGSCIRLSLAITNRREVSATVRYQIAVMDMSSAIGFIHEVIKGASRAPALSVHALQRLQVTPSCDYRLLGVTTRSCITNRPR